MEYLAHVHFVIMGCGRVGASVAGQLEDSGHSVAIIDRDPDAFVRLPDSFEGRRVTGVGFDRDTLRQAGIEDAYAFAAVTNGDNSNIIAARVVRETFGVRNVVARIYDARRAQLFQRLGIPTVAPVPWTSGKILQRLLPTSGVVAQRSSGGDVSVVPVTIVPGWVGSSVAHLERVTSGRVCFIERNGEAHVPSDEEAVQELDLVQLAVPTDLVPRARRLLADPPAASEEN